MTTKHLSQRLDQRILSQSVLPVSYEVGVGEYIEVGTIKVSNLMKTQIKNMVEKIENFDFGTNKDYAVKVTQFQLSTTKFHSDESKRDSIGKKLVVSLTNSEGESNGNEVYCIIRSNVISTFCFVKSYTGFGNLQSKLRVDGIIKNLKNFRK